jgi:PST family polysaccharide transporter
MQKLLGHVSSSFSHLKAIDRQTRLDVFWVGIIQAANYLFPFLATTHLIRTIGVDLFGRTEFATYITLYLITIVNYEFHVTGTRSFSRAMDNPVKINSLFSTIFTAKTWLLAAATLLFCLMTLIWPGRFYNLLFILTYLIVFGHYFYPPYIFQGLGKVRSLAVMNFLIKALSTGLLFITIRRRDDYQWVNLNYSLSYILIGVISFFAAARTFHLHIRWKPWRIVRLALKKGLYIFLTSGIIAQITLNLSAVLLGFFLPSSILGSYSAALKLIIAFQVMAIFPIRQVFFPKLSNAWARDKPRYKKDFKGYFLLMAGSTLVVGILILAFAPWIIRLVYGDYFQQMILCMRMLAFLPFFTALNNIFISDGLIVLGKDRLVFQVQLALAAVNIIVLLVMVPRYGLMPVLIIRNVLEFLGCIAGFIAFRKILIKELKDWNQQQHKDLNT